MKKVITLMLLLVVGHSFAQIKVEGVVKDSIGNPLELANVIAINQETKALESYGITNDQGRYKLALTKNITYTVQVSYIGMKTFEETVKIKESDLTKNFTLQEDNTLDEIQITYEMPVTIKGDTLTYNADSFNKGTERKLGDVLKNLPGVEVNADGQIEIEGKVVGKVMVDGKDFFDGDSKLATKNIPASAVDKVQVLKNYAEVGQLSGVTNNMDNIAINIKLKEGKTNFWFGDITAGGGVSEDNALYLAQPKLFYYSPKYSVNLIGDLNNIGEIAFTRRDYFNFSGGFRAPSRQSGTSINLGSNNLGFLSLQNNRAKDINTKFGAANFSYSPNKKLDLSGFAILSSSRIELQENNSVQYTNSDLGIPDEDTQSNTRQRSDLGMLKLSSKYKPNASNQLDYEVLGRFSKESQDQKFLSSVIGNIDQFENTKPFSVNQNLSYYYTLDEKNIFAFEAQHLLQDEDPFYNAIIEEKANYETTANNLGLDPNQLDYNVAQEKRVKSNQLDAKLDYWNILTARSNINFTLGTILSKQNFDSEIFQYLDDDTVFDPTPTFNDGLDTNNTDYNFSDMYVGAHYQFKTGIFTITPGLSAHAYSSKNVQFGEEYKKNFFKLLPDFDMRIQLKKSENISLTYNMNTQFTDVTNLARGIVLNNYNSIFSGNEGLDNALSHNVNLRYFSFNMFNYTNVFGSINYSKRIDQIRNLTNFESVIRNNSPFNSSFADETISANGRFQRRFGKLQASVNGNFNYSKFNQFIQGNRSVNENYSHSYGAELRTNFREAPNVQLNYRYGIQDNDQGSTRSKFYTSTPSVEVDALILKTFTFRTDFSYNNFSDEEGTINDYEFWNASLSYRKDKDAKLEYAIKATNLLNTKSQSQSNTSNISVSATEYFIQPLYVTFRVIYSL
ncbi:carboxypeptidase regulatory-like domain-containing protein [Gelidibacter sp.]|uniref:carboxypeptidase regulatory-like domain-containing protein n=1 Tax=Gelidibacter sp. TaxID=2018083 RepID=UPI002B67B007|nr:carboxypeptidase regulatory-like domain-containing protein [Gelidibacter sp.]HUH29623.1 carboxypeptidase regulatory-like domain-containing protein [Gelidibacter sp.]